MTDDATLEPTVDDAALGASSDETEMDSVNSLPASAADLEDAVTQSVETPDLPRRKWHDRKWLLVLVVALVAMLVGVGIAAPDRQAAKDEAKKILADAKSDAADLRRDGRDDAKQEREELLGGVKQEKADLLESIEAEKGELAKLRQGMRTAKIDLASIESTRKAKQKQVDRLNRAIRSSTSLSRENAVAKARDYLDYSSFSCQGLIDQLSSDYGEQFSVSDATYAAKQVGLC